MPLLRVDKATVIFYLVVRAERKLYITLTLRFGVLS